MKQYSTGILRNSIDFMKSQEPNERKEASMNQRN
jgi:hypothetical protein